MIELNKVNFQYGSTPVLRDVSITFNKHQFHLIIGPNGGGKTTLLKLVMGLTSPSSGTISIDGKSPFDSRSAIGYVPQNYSFDPLFPLSVHEFVLMGSISELKWSGRWPPEVLNRADLLLKEVEMHKYKDRQIGALSGGQRQRASYARAQMCNPSLLILDEPTTGLDVEASTFMQQKLIALKGKKTILMVSHLIDDVIKHVDSVTCVQGEIERIEKRAVCSHYNMGMYHTKEPS